MAIQERKMAMYKQIAITADAKSNLQLKTRDLNQANQTGNITMIMRTAVRETGSSRHQGCPITGHSEIFQIPRQYGTERFKHDPQLGRHYADSVLDGR